MVFRYCIIMFFQFVFNIYVFNIVFSHFFEIQRLDLCLKMVLQNGQDFKILFQFFDIFFPFFGCYIQMVVLLSNSFLLIIVLSYLFILEINFFLFLESVLEIVNRFFFFHILFLLEQSYKTFFVFIKLTFCFNFLIYFRTTLFYFFGCCVFCFVVVAVD